MVGKKEFDEMVVYFLETYFNGIPKIPCTLEKASEFGDGVDGSFFLRQNEDYDASKDEFLNNTEYGQRIEFDEGFGFIDGIPSWTDPLNHPNLNIIILKDLCKEPLKLIGTLLHELTHYWCWYCGYDYEDGSYQFEQKLKELGLPSNWEHGFDKSKKKWYDSFDYTKMQSYYDKFLESRKE